MPQSHDIGHRKRRTAATPKPSGHSETVLYGYARDLVKRGLASSQILDRPTHGKRQ